MGTEPLVIQCAERLLRRGYVVRAIISAESSIVSWAAANDIRRLDPASDHVAALSEQPVDYLISVGGSAVSSGRPAIPVRSAVNFHDGPLPRYAGPHAPVWALINREPSHGITWHLIRDASDTGEIVLGEIVLQRVFPIADGETLLTLHAKCHEAAIDSFDDMLTRLEQTAPFPAPLCVDLATFHGRGQRPEGASALVWTRTAAELAALARGLYFGRYTNPLGVPKIALPGGETVLVRTLREEPGDGQAPPGLILRADADAIVIACGGGAVAASDFMTPDGGPLTVDECAGRLGLRVGTTLPVLSERELGQRSRLTESLVGHEGFWVKRLRTGEPPRIPYAAAGHQAHVPRASAVSSASVPEGVISAWERRGEAGGMGDFLLTAFVAYLARLGGRSAFDITFRDSAMAKTLEGTAGWLAPHVPLRVELDLAEGFYGAYQRAKEELEAVRLHRTYMRDAWARYPALRARRGAPRRAVGIEQAESFEDSLPSPETVITLVLPASGAEYRWLYDPELVGHAQIEAMQSQFSLFLQGLAADWRRPLAGIPLLMPDDLHQLLIGWNATQTPFNGGAGVHELFEAQVARTPDARAVVFADETLTYAELNARANQLARVLRRHGVRPDTLVGLCIERSADLVIGMLAIHKAGGAYIPLDPGAPRERTGFMLGDAGVGALLTQEHLLAVLPTTMATVITIDSAWETPTPDSAENLAAALPERSLASVIYTAGPTGHLAGVMIEHRSAVNFLTGMNTLLGDDPPGVWLALGSASFDTSVLELLWPLTRGYLVVVSGEDPAARDRRARDRHAWDRRIWHGRSGDHLAVDERAAEQRTGETADRSIAALVARHGVTHMHCTPFLAAMLLATEQSREALRPLRTLLVSGDVLPEQLATELTKLVAGDVFHLHGSTETTVCSTAHKLDGAAGPPPIGRPIANTALYITDANREPVPIGVPGELLIGGAGVARGYLHRPELTAQRFVPNPFATDVSTRLFRTGELARYRPDGTVELLGPIERDRDREPRTPSRGSGVVMGERGRIGTRSTPALTPPRQAPSVRPAVGDPASRERMAARAAGQGDGHDIPDGRRQPARQADPRAT